MNLGHFRARARTIARGLAKAATRGPRRAAPDKPRRILIAHHLLLGDTLMLTPLLAKLRQRHPDAEIVMTVAKPHAQLYAGRPYGVVAIGWDPRDPASLGPIFARPGFDLAFVPADNRHSWLALAAGARSFCGAERAGRTAELDGNVVETAETRLSRYLRTLRVAAGCLEHRSAA